MNSKEKKKVSFFAKLFKSEKSEEDDVSETVQHKQYFSSFKSSNKKKSMEKEWSKACEQMDQRAQILQVNIKDNKKKNFCLKVLMHLPLHF